MDDSAEFRSVLQHQVATYRSGDVAAYLEGYAPDATILVTRSQMNLDQMKTFVKSLFDGGGKALDLQMPKPNVRFSESGDAATFNISWREQFHHPDGHETDSEYQETDVWFRRNGEWKLVNLHLNMISERATKPVKHQ